MQQTQNARPPAASTTGRATTTVTSREPVTFTTPAYTTTTSTTSPFLNAAGQVVGYLVEDGSGKWLTKHVDTRKHQLRAPAGWASDVRILELCAAQQVDGLRLLDEQGAVWQAPLRAFWTDGIAIDRGHGEQLVLPLARWVYTPPGQLPLFAEAVS